MTPPQFLSKVKKKEFPSVCLFLGSESYNRRRCKDALLLESKLEPEYIDAAETPLAAIIDDARALSLFASERLIYVTNAEAAMPRSSRAAAAAEADEDTGVDEGGSGGSDPTPLEAYMKSPTPGVTLIFEATRYDFDGDDKPKNERARKFYGAIHEVVEFKRFAPDDARAEVERIARARRVQMEPAAIEALVEALAADVGRIEVELEKLSLYGKPVRAEDLSLLVPDARQSTIFALVTALGQRNRAKSLEVLDALVREGEYLPLALTFLATQFRMALVAKEANLRSAMQVQGHFQKQGVPMWGSRAEQVSVTANKFSKEQLEKGLHLIFETDRDLRSARPDDRTVVENFVVKLCR